METRRQNNLNTENADLERTQPQAQQLYLSFAEIAQRWRCSRATVYNRLRGVGAEVLDFAAPGKKGKKVVAVITLLRIEEKRTKRLW
jgi:hypothetical protein